MPTNLECLLYGRVLASHFVNEILSVRQIGTELSVDEELLLPLNEAACDGVLGRTGRVTGSAEVALEACVYLEQLLREETKKVYLALFLISVVSTFWTRYNMAGYTFTPRVGYFTSPGIDTR